MCNKILAIIALLGAPFLCIDFLDNQENTTGSWTTGLYGFIYMTGWIASVIGLLRLKAAGTGMGGQSILFIQLLLLSVAQVFNINVIVHGGQPSSLQTNLDLFWPISNGFMLVTGIAVVLAKRIQGWHRWIPLLTGSWLPVLLICNALGFRNLYVAGFYSAIAWTLLAVVVYTAKCRLIKKAMVQAGRGRFKKPLAELHRMK